MKFSVLMSIYYKENPQHFDRAMQSVWDDQTIKPNEIVLVQDGVLIDGLYEAIKEWQNKLGEVFKVIALEENIGLGSALNIGLQNCTYALVARMDTDDISLPNRFEEQLAIFENKDIDICGVWVSEFDKDEWGIVSYRKPPRIHGEIVNFAKKRSPINHPSAMYKKSSVQKAGGYQKMMWFEDYYLWVRMIISGAKFYNIQKPLVNMRIGNGQLARRSGLKYAMSEVRLQREFLRLGFIDFIEFIQNIFIRFSTRILPKIFVIFIYKKIRTK